MGYWDEFGQLRPSVLQSAKGLVGAMAVWSEASQGIVNVGSALDGLHAALETEMIALSRHGRNDGVRLIRRGNMLRSSPERSFAPVVLGGYLARPLIGSVWMASQVDGVEDPALVRFQQRHRLAELAVIPIEVLPSRVDFLECHFAAPTDRRAESALAEIAPVLARIWGRRIRGLFAETLLDGSRVAGATSAAEPILSDDNPTNLSRAEYRVCTLLSRGLNGEAVRTELEISASTLKSHLRNIYAKTGSTGQADLLYRLLSARPVVVTGQARSA